MVVTSREARPQENLSGVILAIDYGRKRLGLAVSDELAVIPRPLAVWNRTNRRRDLARLRDLVRERGVRRIVVGLPLHSDGSASEMSEEARAFAARVRKAIGLPVEMVDERLTSWEAEGLRAARKPKRAAPLSERGRKALRWANQVDDLAAAVILRDYLAGRASEGAPSPVLSGAPGNTSLRQARD